MKRYQCVRFGTCPRADACAKIEIKPGEPYECPLDDPECREKLVKIQDPELRSRVIRIALVFLAAMTIGAGVMIGWSYIARPIPVPPVPTPTPDSLPPLPPSPTPGPSQSSRPLLDPITKLARKVLT